MEPIEDLDEAIQRCREQVQEQKRLQRRKKTRQSSRSQIYRSRSSQGLRGPRSFRESSRSRETMMKEANERRDTQKRVEKLMNLGSKILRSRTDFEVLGVSEDTTDYEIKTKYKKVSSKPSKNINNQIFHFSNFSQFFNPKSSSETFIQTRARSQSSTPTQSSPESTRPSKI